jgi:hypothetical protein
MRAAGVSRAAWWGIVTHPPVEVGLVDLDIGGAHHG